MIEKNRAAAPELPGYAVSREVLMSFFEPPIGRSTCHDLVQQGNRARASPIDVTSSIRSLLSLHFQFFANHKS